MKKLTFTLVFKPEPDDGFTVTIPSLPGCVTYGKNLQEAKNMAMDAISAYLTSLRKHKEPIPSDETTFFTTVNITDSKKFCYHA